MNERREIIDAFHVLHYNEAVEGGTWGSAHWHGTKCWKNPSDLWLYQELIFNLRPAWVIETGTAFGGSALFYAHMMDLIGFGQVLSIDLAPYSSRLPSHHRISYLCNRSSVDPEVLREVTKRVLPKDVVMVSLDSDHSKNHVLAEMDAFGKLVTPNSYMIVEDTDINGHPVYPDFGPGPHEAVEAWLPKHPEFIEDRQLPNRWLFSYHRFLKKRRV